MKVRNLVVWAGPDFCFAPGDVVDVPDEWAKARIASGACVAVETEQKAAAKPKKAKDD